MTALIDLTGCVFGRLVVVGRARGRKPGKTYWICNCECGESIEIAAYPLSHGRTSCGCDTRENWRGAALRFHLRHGLTRTGNHHPLYKTWIGMKSRCHRRADAQFFRYGARGISVCDRWLGRDGFVHFIEDMGPRPSQDHSVDRIDNDGNYEPSNCRWATRSEQQRNKRTSKLTEADVLELLRLRSEGWTHARLGERFGIGARYAGAILSGTVWRDVVECYRNNHDRMGA